MDKDVFHALVSKLITVPIELCILDSENRAFTFYRKDLEYDGHHIPGTVLRDNETVQEALNRLIQSEVVDMEISQPENIGWCEIRRGAGYGENPTRHEISLIFLARLKNAYHGNVGVFSPLDELPDNIIPHHRILLDEVKVHLKNKNS